MIKNYVTYGSALAALILGVGLIMPIRQGQVTQELVLENHDFSMMVDGNIESNPIENIQSSHVEDDNLSHVTWLQIQERNEHELVIAELENSIASAVLTKLAIWNNPHEQTTIYAQHCRRLRYGCERQVRQFSRYIAEVATEFHIDPWLFSGMAWHESRFNPGAESNMGAVGIFQLLRTGPASRGIHFVHQRRFREACSRVLGVCQRPIVVRAAEWFLASIEQCHGSVADGLRAYNSGDCNGPRRYYRAVFEARDELLEISRR